MAASLKFSSPSAVFKHMKAYQTTPFLGQFNLVRRYLQDGQELHVGLTCLQPENLARA
jgi:hypothetical protein